MLSELLECDLRKLEAVSVDHVEPRFDTRDDGDVAVVTAPGWQSILNSRFSSDLLFHGNQRAYERFLDVTGMRERVVFWCMYDSGDSSGFAVFEDGQAVRHCLYRSGVLPEDWIAHGTPVAAERPWKPAVITEDEKKTFDPGELESMKWFRHDESRLLLNEYNLGHHIVEAVLKDEFGFSVRDEGDGVRETWYRAVQAEASRPLAQDLSCPAVPDGPAAKPGSWWRRLFR